MAARASNRALDGSPGSGGAWWRGSLAAVLDVLFPPRCLACGAEIEPSGVALHFCPACDRELAIARQPTCSRCALACAESDVALGNCGHCRSRKLLFTAARTIGPYREGLRQAVLLAKQASYEPLAAALGQRLSETMERQPFSARPELVMPVPVYWLKRLWRRTHTAATIAQAVARATGLPLAAGALVCRRYLRRQATLTPAQRRQNVRGAFRVSWWGQKSVAGKRVLLVDDVMTTGATAHEASRALLQAGAAEIFVATVARSSPDF